MRFYDNDLNIFKKRPIMIHGVPEEMTNKIEDVLKFVIDPVYKSGNFYCFSKKLTSELFTYFSNSVSLDDMKKLLYLFEKENGCFISDELYIFYTIADKKSSILYCNPRNTGGMDILGYVEIEFKEKTFDYNIIIENFEDEETSEDLCFAYMIQTLMKIIFKNYVDIETVTIKKSNPREKLNSIKYVNKSKYPITIIDSTWYRNIVCGPFGVKGHFRLQAYGSGRKLRKLMWIKPFIKEGYSRKAKKN
jgi:hypothetical protein